MTKKERLCLYDKKLVTLTEKNNIYHDMILFIDSLLIKKFDGNETLSTKAPAAFSYIFGYKSNYERKKVSTTNEIIATRADINAFLSLLNSPDLIKLYSEFHDEIEGNLISDDTFAQLDTLIKERKLVP
jgi:hypothetical protein